MKEGYGRGYYGEGQLAQPPRPRRSGWTKWAIAVGVVGAGTVIWLMWPRKSDSHGAGPGEDPRSHPPHPAVTMDGPQMPPPVQLAPPGTEVRGLPYDTEGRGYPQGAEMRGAPYESEGRGYPQGAAMRGGPYGGRGIPPGAEMRRLAPGGAELRGLPPGRESQQAYEDAVVASARQLQATGAKIILAPHLAHLAHRIA